MKSLILQNNKLVKVAAITTLFAMLVWTVGLQTARGAGITSFDDTLSDSAPTVPSDHEIEFVTASGVSLDGDTIVIAFDNAVDSFNLSSIALSDIDLLEDTDGTPGDCTGTLTQETLVAAAGDTAAAEEWEVTINTTNDEITFDPAPTGGLPSVAASACVIVRVGLNASGGTNQIDNPVAGSYPISVSGGFGDSGETRVFVIDNISMTATVDTIFNFWIIARTNGEAAANGEAGNNDISTTPSEIPWGEITTGAYLASHTLDVETNATNGFVVTLEQDADLTSSSSDTIDLFADGAETATPTAWASPTGTLGNVNEYGHWGVTSEDDLNTDEFAGTGYVGNLNSPRQIFENNGPADGDGAGGGTADIGTTVVGYKLEIMGLQEAGDYENTLTYIATPTF